MEYQTQEITLPGTHWKPEPLTIFAQVAEETGLCYHATGGDPSYGWTITHLSSVKALCTPIGTEHEVRMLLERVAGITDWNQGEKALMKTEIATEFKKCQKSIRQELNMQLETAMHTCMPDYLVEDCMSELQDDEYPVIRNALLYAFKIVPSNVG